MQLGLVALHCFVPQQSAEPCFRVQPRSWACQHCIALSLSSPQSRVSECSLSTGPVSTASLCPQQTAEPCFWVHPLNWACQHCIAISQKQTADLCSHVRPHTMGPVSTALLVPEQANIVVLPAAQHTAPRSGNIAPHHVTAGMDCGNTARQFTPTSTCYGSFASHCIPASTCCGASCPSRHQFGAPCWRAHQ